jgi:transcriptional regulator with XRE-family HTH domain
VARRLSIATLEQLPMRERLRTIRGRDTQAAFAAETGFSVRQIKRWEKGTAAPTRSSALDLEATTGYPARLFLPAPEPTLAELGEKLDLIIALLGSRDGRRR